MSVQFRIADQLLKVSDKSSKTESVVHRYDAFLNLLSSDKYAFQRDAIREALRFLISDTYPTLEQLARENWTDNEAIRQRHSAGIDSFLDLMPLNDRKSSSIDLATGTGKSYVMYGLAAIALAEGLVDRVLVLCPSLTIEEGLLEKFTALAGNNELSGIMQDLGAKVAIPAIKRGNETIHAGDICIENIHAVYENTGSSIRDSFKGFGGRTLVLNDEAHHLFAAPDKAMKEWMKFLQDPLFGFRFIINVTGTPYVDDEYFPDVIYRYGLKQSVGAKVVKRPNYKLEDTQRKSDWQRTHKIHESNRATYGSLVKPLCIVVTADIARCVEVWRELVDFLVRKERLTPEQAEKKAIWVTSSVPTSGAAKDRINAAYSPRNDKDSPEKRRKENLATLKHVDNPECPVEWIVSVAMLSEGWDVKNVFLIVPHESRAFNSKLLIAQVLGRGLRIPSQLPKQPFVTIDNHEKWAPAIGKLLKEVLEEDNALTWGYDPRRKEYVFPLHNLVYEPEQQTVVTRHRRAQPPNVTFGAQAKRTTETSTFSETGRLAVEIDHQDIFQIDAAAKYLRLFIRGKDAALAKVWTKEKLRKFIVKKLKDAGQDTTFISKANLLRLQQGFGPMFRGLAGKHPRMGKAAKELVAVDITALPRQSFTETALKEHGAIYSVDGDTSPVVANEVPLWEQYQKFCEAFEKVGTLATAEAQAIANRLHQIDLKQFKTPVNIHYASHEPERKFSDLLFDRSDLFDSFVKMPNTGGYGLPYSYKPAKAAKTHVANETFNPDFFIKVADKTDILVVEVKDDSDDSNRNRAKCRDGLRHFETLNERLKAAKEPWRYYFFFLSPDDYTRFFEVVKNGEYKKGWRSSLMAELLA